MSGEPGECHRTVQPIAKPANIRLSRGKPLLLRPEQAGGHRLRRGVLHLGGRAPVANNVRDEITFHGRTSRRVQVLTLDPPQSLQGMEGDGVLSVLRSALRRRLRR